MQSIQNPSPDFRWARVVGTNVRPLDRYVNIQPWHNNRVKLGVPQGKLDYINASPIHLPGMPPAAHHDTDRFIAMQGPKQISVDHVWRMVVEQLESPGVIVMLTETHEQNIEKCFQYFPRRVGDAPMEINARDEFGDGFRATVHCEAIQETSVGDAIEMRKLVVRIISPASTGNTSEAAPERDGDLDVKMKSPRLRSQDSTSPAPESRRPQGDDHTAGDSNGNGTKEEKRPVEERTIWHLLYKKWPDFGVPDLADLDSFFELMRLSRELNANPSNPRIVHCSAGVGRSGTFITLEHLWKQLEAGTLQKHYGSATATTQAEEPLVPDIEVDVYSEDELDEVSAGEGLPESLIDHPEDPIFQTVNLLREQRRTMVQAEAQYSFIYQVMRKLWNEKYATGPTPKQAEKDCRERAAKRHETDTSTAETGS
jgi:protein-tyrosine phosphatase